jgi:isopentenyldiphosphate isomerase
VSGAEWHRSSPSTTDPQDELFDVLRPDGSPAGYAKARGQVHRDGDWHTAVHIWIGGIGATGAPFVIFQRRSLTKDTWPGALDVAVGGHVRAGETVAATLREAEEELGLALDPAALVRIGRRFASGSHGGVVDREVQEVFAVRCDQPLDAYRLHPEEVDAVVALGVHDALALFHGTSSVVTAWTCPSAGTVTRTTVTLADFVAAPDGYVPVALAALEALLRGSRPRPFELHPD